MRGDGAQHTDFGGAVLFEGGQEGYLVPGAAKGRRCVPKLVAAGCELTRRREKKKHWGKGDSMGFAIALA